MRHFSKVIVFLSIWVLYGNCVFAADDTVVDAAPASDQELFNQAFNTYRAGKLDKAINLYKQVLSLNPSHESARWARGAVYLKQGKFDMAIVDFKEEIRLAPENATGYGMLGWALILSGQFDEALIPAKKANELNPRRETWAFNLGHAYLLTGDDAKARHYYEMTIKIVPDDDTYRHFVDDFEMFLKNGWSVDAVKQTLAWFEGAWKQEKLVRGK